MASWHRRARIGVAVFGLAVAGIVYFTMRERQAPAPRSSVSRTDEKAIFEAKGSDLTRTLPESISKLVSFDDVELIQGYEDGSTRLTGGRIVVRRGEKEFVASAREAWATRDSKHLELFGNVKMRASDGLELATERGVYNADEGLVSTMAPVTFSKGRMSGSGVGITYDEDTDVLTIGQQARIEVRDASGKVTTELTAASAILDRLQDVVTLNDGAHVVKDGQVIDARNAVANLSANEEVIRFIRLTGDARVTGAGSSIDSMSAPEIDLDYTDDGATLERVALRGGGAIAMTGRNEEPGRRIIGDTLDLSLAPDGSLLQAEGKGSVQLDLPAVEGSASRSIRASTLDARGEEGKGLTEATFTGDVSFTENAAGGASRRSAGSQTLQAGLASDVVTNAIFTGRAWFEEDGLTAGAARMEYQPEKGTLSLTGTEGNAVPCVADDRVTVGAQTIDVTLEEQRFIASGNVRTLMRGQASAGAECGGRTVTAASSRADGEEATRLPGLFDQKASATVSADGLDYQGVSGKVVYTGTPKTQPTMIQGQTSIRGTSIAIDQATGDLVATGAAIANIVLDGEDSQAGAHELRYTDARRLITLTGAPPAGRGAAVAPTPVRKDAWLVGPQGDLAAVRIEVILAAGESRVERIEAVRNVSMQLDARTLTGATALTYQAAEDRYEAAGSPLFWFERDGKDCRQNSGTKLTILKSGSEVELDGTQLRFQTTPKPCPPGIR
jgi:LPS export ABC transporter protein LptC